MFVARLITVFPVETVETTGITTYASVAENTSSALFKSAYS